MSTDRYARHLALPEIGEAGQNILSKSHVLIVGIGGLGCPAAQYLAGSGIGTLILNDFDCVDESNLSRQVLFEADTVGELKVEAAKRRLQLINPDLSITCFSDRLDQSKLLSVIESVSVVIDATDNFTSRLAINRAAVQARVPLVTGAAIRFEGQLSVFPNNGNGPCYRCLYDDEDEWLGNCQGNGVASPVPGVIGTLMALETIKVLLRLNSSITNHLHLWDAKQGGWQDIAITINAECLDCQA